MNESTVRLPDKLSDLIDLAVRDARGLDRERYGVDYSCWHVGDPESVEMAVRADRHRCVVCDAGAVIAGTLGWNPKRNAEPIGFDDHTKYKLLALDSVRTGNFYRALSMNGTWDAEKAFDVGDEVRREAGESFARYTDWETFDLHLLWLERVAAILRDRGL